MLTIFSLYAFAFIWTKQKHPIIGYDLSKPIDNPVNQTILKSGKISLGWSDYVFGPSLLVPAIFNILELKQ